MNFYDPKKEMKLKRISPDLLILYGKRFIPLVAIFWVVGFSFFEKSFYSNNLFFKNAFGKDFDPFKEPLFIFLFFVIPGIAFLSELIWCFYILTGFLDFSFNRGERTILKGKRLVSNFSEVGRVQVRRLGPFGGPYNYIVSLRKTDGLEIKLSRYKVKEKALRVAKDIEEITGTKFCLVD